MATATTKPSATIFYAWQSDLPKEANRFFVQWCLERAIKELHREGELKVDPRIDRDTLGVSGARDIADEIYEKIDQCQVFVADVSIINKGAKIEDKACRPTPNPNVLLELGYAAQRLQWGGVIPILNLAFGPVEDLPFDLRKRRTLTYNLAENAETSVRDEQRKQVVDARSVRFRNYSRNPHRQ